MVLRLSSSSTAVWEARAPNELKDSPDFSLCKSVKTILRDRIPASRRVIQAEISKRLRCVIVDVVVVVAAAVVGGGGGGGSTVKIALLAECCSERVSERVEKNTKCF